MKKQNVRTALAFGLTAIALAVPCAAWYVVGCREAEREAARLEETQWREARETAAQLAERVHTRIQTLREAEEKRPFYHYQNLYHDPKGAYEGASVLPSPLAQGPTDPLVRAYFQVDAAGRLTLPTFNAEVQEVGNNVGEDVPVQQALQRELEPAVSSSSCISFLTQAGRAKPQLQFAANTSPAPQQASSSLAQQGQQIALSQQPQSGQVRQKKEILDPTAWDQNLKANALYADIRNFQNGKVVTKEVGSPQAQTIAKGNIEIGIGPFQWCTTPIGREPSLVALREVTTPQGNLIQGFVISSSTVAESLRGAACPARFAPSAASKPGQIAVPIEGTTWQVLVDASRAIADAGDRAKAVRQTFLRFFFGGVAAAAVAGLCVVGLVWKTEQLARQRSQFAASAAHELRTPLAGLRIYSEMLTEGLGDPSRAKEYARRVAGEAERLGRVVANVLGFTRLERGTLTVHRELGDLVAAVRDCVERQQPALEAAGARVELAIAESLPAVRFDRDAVAQIVQNLLDNAEKHTRSASDRTIHVALSQVADRLVLSISDHGPGIPAEVRRRLFRPFTRGKNADAPAGLGLGLVLVQALARAQGSQITCADAAGGGAVFTVTFTV